MRVLIVVLIVMGLLFAGVVVFGAVRQGGEPERPRLAGPGAAPACGDTPGPSGRFTGPPPMDGDEVDEDAVEDWRPPNLGQRFACWTARFAPRLKLPLPNVRAGDNPMAPARRTVPFDPKAGPNDIRIARVQWTAGAPMLARYLCDGDDCQAVCVCQPGRQYDEDVFDRCRDKWVDQRRREGRVTCRTGDDSGTLVIYQRPASIEFLGLGGTSDAVVK